MTAARLGPSTHRGAGVEPGRSASFESAVLADTLRFQTSDARGAAARWLGAPIGMAAHGGALAALLLAALYAPSTPEAPSPPRLLLQLAPPPPAPIRRGAELSIQADRVSGASARPRPVSASAVSPRPLSIPDEVLAPSFELQLGSEEGFDDGIASGMPGGIPGGVAGGVPGGLVGGTVGGTGKVVPRLPRADVGPSPIRMPQPSYTREAIRDNVRGEVVLRVIIDERGEVSVLEVLRSVPGLDEEAIRVVENRWRFQPATKNGRPVPALSDLRVLFNLY